MGSNNGNIGEEDATALNRKNGMKLIMLHFLETNSV